MISAECIFPECYADTLFVRMCLGLNGERLNHKHGKTKVLKALDEIKVPKALAIIDKDPGASVKIDLTQYNYTLMDQDTYGFLKLYKHSINDYWIIEINKEFEDWIFRQLITETGIVPTNLGMPNDWYETDYLKDQDVGKKKGVWPFFNALIASNTPSIMKFKEWLTRHTQ